MLICRVVDDLAGLDRISTEWDRLLVESEFPNVYGTSGFVRAWWRAYGAGRTLRIVTVHDPAGELRLVAPFFFDDASPEVWRVAGTTKADYTNLVSAAGDHESVNALFSWLLRQSDWRQAHIEHIPADAAIIGHFARAYGPESTRAEKVKCWLGLPGPLVYRKWHEEHPLIRGENLRRFAGILESSHVRRKIASLRRQGELEYRSLASPEAILAALPSFIEMHVAEWGAKHDPSLFLDEANRRFFEYLVGEAARYDAVRLDLLTLGGQPIAAHYGFTWQERVLYYKSAFDPAHASGSPGLLLLSYIIDWAVRARAAEVDLLYGLEDYKMRYASEIRRTAEILLFRRPWAAALARVRRRAS